MQALPSSPAALRNREAILGVLEEELRDARKVLEVGSGTAEHATFFVPRMPWLTWQTADRADYLDGIIARLDAEPDARLKRPIELDVNSPPALSREYDAVYSANTAHIMSLDEVEKMFGLVGGVLVPGGVFCLYGPFNLDGAFTSPSNEAFDASLRARDPRMGIRDLETLDRFAGARGLERRARHTMPANNQMVVWQRS